jgi:hypothetical protein
MSPLTRGVNAHPYKIKSPAIRNRGISTLADPVDVKEKNPKITDPNDMYKGQILSTGSPFAK